MSRFCISTLKPRSFEACSPISRCTAYDTPMWRSVMPWKSRFMICGNPLIGTPARAVPATAATVAFNMPRRLVPLVPLASLVGIGSEPATLSVAGRLFSSFMRFSVGLKVLDSARAPRRTRAIRQAGRR